MSRRGRRGPGVPIIPSRVRQARAERGLSLADLAGADVSRAFIHQLEQGLARPSRQVLEMIADRTGKSVSFFTITPDPEMESRPDISTDLIAISRRVDRLGATLELTESHREAFRLVVTTLRQAARVVAAVSREQRTPDVTPTSPAQGA